MTEISQRKKNGPMSGKCVALLSGPEFSDFQAYYLNLYLSELGAKVVNLVVGWPEVSWKMTRPATSDTVQGTFGLRLDPIPTMAYGERYITRVFRRRSDLAQVGTTDFDALIVLGGHSADVLRVDTAVTEFVSTAWKRGLAVGALECGQMVLMSAGVIRGQSVTGHRVIRPFLSRLGQYQDLPVVSDGNLITGRDSNATPQFVRALARYFKPDWCDPSDDLLQGKCILIVAGQDFEDVELCVPAMELDRRGAKVILGTFPTPVVSRPPMLGLDVVMGNFGMSVPFQELDSQRFPVKRLAELSLTDFDAMMIPGAFCPWNCIDEGSPVELCRQAAAAGKVVAAICHGPLVLAAAELVEGRHITGFAACRDDVITMGAFYNDSWPALIDGNIVTGRVPDDVPEFIDAITDALCGTNLLDRHTATMEHSSIS